MVTKALMITWAAQIIGLAIYQILIWGFRMTSLWGLLGILIYQTLTVFIYCWYLKHGLERDLGGKYSIFLNKKRGW